MVGVDFAVVDAAEEEGAAVAAAAAFSVTLARPRA